MPSTTQPALRLITLELTKQQAEIIFNALSAYIVGSTFPERNHVEVLQGSETIPGYSPPPDFKLQSHENMDAIFDKCWTNKYGTGEIGLIAANDSELEGYGEVIQLKEGESLQVNPS